jgi:hypothetical protein
MMTQAHCRSGAGPSNSASLAAKLLPESGHAIFEVPNGLRRDGVMCSRCIVQPACSQVTPCPYPDSRSTRTPGIYLAQSVKPRQTVRSSPPPFCHAKPCPTAAAAQSTPPEHPLQRMKSNGIHGGRMHGLF